MFPLSLSFRFPQSPERVLTRPHAAAARFALAHFAASVVELRQRQLHAVPHSARAENLTLLRQRWQALVLWARSVLWSASGAGGEVWREVA